MTRPSLLRRLAEPLLMGLYPGRCAGCDQPLPWRADDEAFCEACTGLLERPEGACPTCGLPRSGPDAWCEACLLESPLQAALRAAWWYGGPARAAVHRFKFEQRPHLYRPLSAALPALVDPTWPVGAVAGVPMTDRALAKRGYNPAWLLGLGLARRAGLPRPGASTLVKVRETAPQRGLGARERRENVRDAFACRAPVAGLHVVLVDDVVTTGATARECVRVLLGAGASSVRVVCLARTPLEATDS